MSSTPISFKDDGKCYCQLICPFTILCIIWHLEGVPEKKPIKEKLITSLDRRFLGHLVYVYITLSFHSQHSNRIGLMDI